MRRTGVARGCRGRSQAHCWVRWQWIAASAPQVAAKGVVTGCLLRAMNSDNSRPCARHPHICGQWTSCKLLLPLLL